MVRVLGMCVEGIGRNVVRDCKGLETFIMVLNNVRCKKPVNET